MEAIGRLSFYLIKRNVSSISTRNILYRNAVPKNFAGRCRMCTAVTEAKNLNDDRSNEIAHEIPVYKPNLTEEQSKFVLQVLNSANVDALTSFKLSKPRAKNLVSFRQKNGDFSCISDVMHVENFGIPILDKLCSKIVEGDNKIVESHETSKKKRKVDISPISPVISNEKRETISSVTGVELTPTVISWARLSLETNRVTHWGCSDVFADEKRVKETVILEMAHRIHTELPKSDAYVFEEKTFRAGPQKFSPIKSQMKQLQVMLSTLLNVPFDSSSPLHKVFFIKQFALAQLFQIFVGSERVSTQHITEDMLRRFRKDMYRTVLDSESLTEEPELPYTSVSWETTELSQIYSSSNIYLREHLSSALIIATAFADIGVRQKPEALAALKKAKNLIKPKKNES